MSLPPVFVDTSYLVALHNKNDEHHKTALAWFTRLDRSSRKMVTTTAVIMEVGNSFCKPGSFERISPFLDGMFSDPLLVIHGVGHVLIAKARDLRKQCRDKKWGLTDCTSFLLMWELGITEALTSDDDFRQARFRALLLDGMPSL